METEHLPSRITWAKMLSSFGGMSQFLVQLEGQELHRKTSFVGMVWMDIGF
jgi:hypothetical protein